MWVQTHSQRVSDREPVHSRSSRNRNRIRRRDPDYRDPDPDNPDRSRPQSPTLVSASASASASPPPTASALSVGDPAAAPPLITEGSFLLLDDFLATTSFRDSFSSTAYDPFLLRYGSSSSGAPIAHTSPSHRHDLQQQPWPRLAKIFFEPSKNAMESINIAVIGADGVGKSSFVQQALKLPRQPSLNVTALRQDVDGVTYVVTLVELDLEVFDLDPEQPIQWPKQIGGHMVPRMDGALILYDVTNMESSRDIPTTMAALANSSLPTALVATKYDAPEDQRQVNTINIAAAFPACVYHFKTSANIPGSSREALHSMLRAAVSSRRGSADKSDGLGPRRRAASTANLDPHLELVNGRPISQHSKHSRASSDFSLLRGFPPPTNDGRVQFSRSPKLEYQIHSPYKSSQNPNSDVPEDGPSQTVSSMLRTPGIRLDGGIESFLDIEESDAESYRYSDDIPILQRNDESFMDRPARVAGVTFDGLVDRLVAPKMTRADNNFVDIFLCLYRKFATPGELFAAIVARLERVKNDRVAQYLTKVECQMRTIEVMAKWLSLYPGDFARPVTKRRLEELIGHLSAEMAFSAAAQQMRTYLERRVVEDDDTNWANADPLDEDATAAAAGRKQSQAAEASLNPVQLLEEPAGANHRRPSQSSELSTPETQGGPTPAKFQFHSFEDFEREAATMVPTATLPLNKIRYHSFMEINPEIIADEITRIDWVMFSSIRIRDMVRHVSLPAEQKEKCRSLKNVDRMVTHFNHVARWVANMVLIRDKVKHRAPCLEKFMVIALKLRQLNNYNGLAAVLAGINGTAVHRLSQTRALVSADVQKRFARLCLLMGTQKSHFAYRLAWENSPLPRIPFMPLHRRDLVSAEEGSRTFVGPNGDRVNWKKYEVLGEVLLPIMKSQGQPYPDLMRHEVSKELILDCRMMEDEEDIYQRSLQLEPSTGGTAESSKKKFPWLAK
ncbi:ras guanine nucleotide exchange factor domain-containing protein [Bombardia bombarda]|uniref:Ras guanine nucleotide exchange factor domain-containing protein n=1 Tax=Bombardia bombarda TaxID=252184 RepID=A0AA39W4Y7_9PEZI|nr:ras guanine nucleotide exchange factor domain-containing protein [Bombardia bombarda]